MCDQGAVFAGLANRAREALLSIARPRRVARGEVLIADGAAGEPVAEGAAAIALPLSRQELADLTGTTLATAIRVMTRWAREGLVATRRGGFVLLDRPRLETLSLR